jgi:CheY-like chemotaxis protein
MRVLMVDDFPELLSVSRLLLERAGITVWTASSPEEARSLNDNTFFDAAVIDYHLGRTNGAALAAELKAANPRLKVILTSGSDEIPPEELVLVDAYYTKGFQSSEDLAQMLHRLTKKSA